MNLLAVESHVNHDGSTIYELEKMSWRGIVGPVNTRAFGQNVKRLRQRPELDITATELAARVGVSKSVVSRLENGHLGLPETPTVIRYANALGVPVDALLAGIDPIYDARAKPDRPIVIQNPPSPERGGVRNAPARTDARVVELEAQLADVTELLSNLIGTARAAARNMERTRARIQGKTPARRKA